MCRLLGFAGDDKETFDTLFDCLKEAARNDPLNPKDPVHGDGWGYVVVNEEGIEHYRSVRPIFEDSRRPQIKGYSLAVVHARQTSFPELVSARHSHPFHYLSELGDFFFAHNGSVDRDRLAGLLGVKDPQKYVDSELAGLLISRLGVEEGYRSLRAHMRTSLDSFVLHVSPDKEARLYTYGDFDLERVKSKGLREDYYQLFVVRGAGFEAVVSSSLLQFEKCRTFSSLKLENGRVLTLGRAVRLK